MEKELLALSANDELERLGGVLENISKDEMIEMVERILTTGDQNFMKLLMALFKGLKSQPKTTPSQTFASSQSSLLLGTKMTCLFMTCVEFLAHHDLSIKVATELVRLLIVEMDSLPVLFLVKLSNTITAYLRNPKIESYRFLELLPKLLHLVGTKYSVPVETGSVGGKEFQNSVVNSICSINWNSSSVVHLASVFKEIHLSVDELQSIVLKFMKAMHSIDVQEIPPLIYQLLILSSKGCKNLLLDGIIRYFNGEVENESRTNEVVGTIIDDIDMLENPTLSHPPATTTSSTTSRNQQIESTVIYHVTFSIKQNQELGKEFIKYLKAHQHSGKREMLSSFVISLALSISKISVFESQVLDLLKHVVTYCFKDQRKKFESKWMQENSVPAYDVAGHVMGSVKQMLVEWDIVMEGLVSFAFSLMEVSANKTCFGKPASNTTGGFQLPTPAQNLNSLGMTILEEGSKVHSNVAVEIVNQLSNRIITKGRDQVPGHFSELLISLLKNSPHTYVDNSTKFRDTFDYFSFLPLATTRLLVTAMLPVVRISPPLKNALVIFLRKSLFSRKIEMRKMAVSGFLLLLKNFKVLTGFSSSQSQGSSSQVAADVHRNNKLSSSDNKSLCLEVINSLRRCFDQQHEVRVLLYYGLCDVAACNPVLLGPIADLLLNQLKNYFDPNEASLPPLKIFDCISLNSDTWKPTEPISDLIKSLICCLFHLKNKSSRDDDEEAFLTRADAILASTVTRLAQSDAEDFEMDKELGFDVNTVAGSRNVSLAQLTVEVYEVFLQRTVVHEDVDQESVEKMLNLFDGLNRIVDATRQVEPNKKTKAKKPNASSEIQKSSPCIFGHHFSLDFIVKVARAMFEGNENISNLILSKITFCNYFFNSATTSLQQFSASNLSTDDFQFRFCSYAVGQPDLITSDLCDLGRLLLKKYIKAVIKPQSNDITIPATATNNANKNIPNTTKAFNSHCLKFFHQILLLFSKRWPNKMTEFLIHLDVMNKSNKKIIEKDPTEGPVLYIKIFQRIFFTLLTSDGELHNNKDCLTTMQCLVVMIGHCQRETVLSECCDWLTRLFKEHVIEDSELLKLMLKQLLSLLRRTELNLTFMKEVCKDIHMCLGDINQEVELDKSSSLPTVNHRSSVVIIQSVLSHLELEIEDSDWWIERTKNQLICDSFSNLSLLTKSGEEEVSPRGKAKGGHSSDQPIRDRCKNLIVRLSSMTDILHELVQTSIPFGPTVELTFKILNKFYLLLTSLVKLYIRNYSDKGKRNDISVQGPYERLIKHSATQLTNFIYPMITHVEKVESEKLQAENEKHKSKKKNATVEKVKRMKETKLVPSLILSLEQYERLLIQLSKKSKVNLMLHFKVSTSRDFRINNAALQGILENPGNDSDYGSDGDGDDVSRRSGTNSVTTANDNDDDGDVEEEKSDDEDEVDDGSSDVGRGDVEDCEMSAPARKRAKLSEILPQPKGIANRRMLSRKNRN